MCARALVHAPCRQTLTTTVSNPMPVILKFHLFSYESHKLLESYLAFKLREISTEWLYVLSCLRNCKAKNVGSAASLLFVCINNSPTLPFPNSSWWFLSYTPLFPIITTSKTNYECDNKSCTISHSVSVSLHLGISAKDNAVLTKCKLKTTCPNISQFCSSTLTGHFDAGTTHVELNDQAVFCTSFPIKKKK